MHHVFWDVRNRYNTLLYPLLRVRALNDDDHAQIKKCDYNKNPRAI